jgi:hypothetical protein
MSEPADDPQLMPLNWATVRAEHVTRACDLVVSGQRPPRAKAKDLFIAYEGHNLPAKHVLRLAYLLANHLPLHSDLRFASGEGTIKRLRGLGFTVTRAAIQTETTGGRRD